MHYLMLLKFVVQKLNKMDKFDNQTDSRRVQMRRDQLLTVQDLIDFKDNLMSDIKKLLKESAGVPGHQWLKAVDIKKMLRLSDGKLQYLRDKGVIPFKKLGGVTYYNLDDIQELMSSGKLNNKWKVA
jgi:hypothetical protein